MLAKVGYEVVYVAEPKIKTLETQPGPVSMRITIEGANMVRGIVKEVKTYDVAGGEYHIYILEDGTSVSEDAAMVIGFGPDYPLLLEALLYYAKHLRKPVVTSVDLHHAARADGLRGAFSYDTANADRLRKLPIPFQPELP